MRMDFRHKNAKNTWSHENGKTKIRKIKYMGWNPTKEGKVKTTVKVKGLNEMMQASQGL